MDTSNPVLPSDRYNIMQVLANTRLRRRQNLGYLAELAKTSERTMLSVHSTIIDPQEVRDIYKRFVESIPRVDIAKEAPLPGVIEVELEQIPICGLVGSDGIPLHPPTVNNRAGQVSVVRKMGGQPGAPMGLVDITAIYGENVLNRKHVYTAGTWKGFMNRLVKQMGRKTTSIRQSYLNEHGVNYSQQAIIKELNHLMPRSKSTARWPSLDGDLNEMLAQIEITGSSSAGPPYWRNKGECMIDVLETGIPTIVAAIKTGSITRLHRENPEMFLCEVKNKMDRYDMSKLDDKTRPYCCIPAHWAALFSILTQRFQETLHVFGGSVETCNAYGFSAANGGLTRMYDWMRNAKKPRVVCYGDDTCLVVPTRNGVYRVDPDFEQMDGSVDNDDIGLVIRWIMSSLYAEDGEAPKFWGVVAEVWHVLSADPRFVMEGTSVYKKKSPHGFMSGVPGTTLFTTVKSVLSWNLYINHCRRTGINILDFKNVNSFMTKCGLVIKSGTWQPSLVPGSVQEGDLVTDHKFLGVQMLCRFYKNQRVIVPTVPEEDALEMLVVQKDSPFEKIGGYTAKRRLYDRMRGLFITVGFTHVGITDAIHNVVNNLDPVAILMNVQHGNGLKPEHIMLQDFDYPDSSGFPTEEFCLSLYAGGTRAGWIQLYPNLVDILDEFRQENRFVKRVIVGDDVKRVILQPDDFVFEASELPYMDECGTISMLPVVNTKFDLDAKPHTRSHVNVGKHNKNLVESVTTFMNGKCVSTVGEISDRFGITNRLSTKASVNGGMYVTGSGSGDLISQLPIQTPIQTEQLVNARSSASDADLITPGVSNRVKIKNELKSERPDKFLATAPASLYLNPNVMQMLRGVPVVTEDLVSSLIMFIAKQSSIKSVRFKSGGVQVEAANPVRVLLQVQRSNSEWVDAASASSLNTKLAREYIARAVFGRMGVHLPEDRYTVTSNQTKEHAFNPEASWYDNTVEAETVERHVQWRQPSVVSEPAFDQLHDRIVKQYGDGPLVDRIWKYVEFFIANGKSVQDTIDIVLNKVAPLEANRTDLPESGSKRSKLSLSRKRALNRKTLERRKRRKSLSE